MHSPQTPPHSRIAVVEQAPSWQMFTVHSFPSSQGAKLNLVTQPRVGSQVLSVQMLPSSQSRVPADSQTPSRQTSPVVHASRSSQGLVLNRLSQPEMGLQESVVQRLPSSQSRLSGAAQTPSVQ